MSAAPQTSNVSQSYSNDTASQATGVTVAPISALNTLPSYDPPMVLLARQHNPNTAVLTNVPPFLRYPRNLRDWIYTCCGSCSVFYSCEIKRSPTLNAVTAAGSTSNPNNQNQEKEEKGSKVLLHHHGNDSSTAVIRMSHSNGAIRFVRNWNVASSRMLQEKIVSNNGFEKESVEGEVSRSAVSMRAFLMPSNFNEQMSHSVMELSPETKQNDAKYLEFIWQELYSQRLDTELAVKSADESMVSKLIEAYTSIQERQASLDAGETLSDEVSSSLETSTRASNIIDGSVVSDKSVTTQDYVNASDNTRKLDVSKVAAAAGGIGAYDEEADPLNAPEVLQAVVAFKKSLEEKDDKIKARRKDFIDKRLNEEIKKARSRLEDERRRVVEQESKKVEMSRSAALPPPPPPLILPVPTPNVNAVPLPPVPQGGLIKPPVPPPMSTESRVIDSGRRGLSNLPSWMTKTQGQDDLKDRYTIGDKRQLEEKSSNETQPAKSQKLTISHANRDINGRKQRVDLGTAVKEMNSTRDQMKQAEETRKSWSKEEILADDASFPLLQKDDAPELRQFVKVRMTEYLGEEEATIIDFIMDHLEKPVPRSRTTKALLEELTLVLDEDAEIFVVDLFQKLLEVSCIKRD